MADQSLPYVYAGPVAAAASVLPSVASILLGARIYNRLKVKQPLGPDDWLMIAATLCCWGMGIVLLRGIQQRLVGYPEPPLDPAFSQLTDVAPGQAELNQLEYAFWALMILTFGLVKLAVLFFYRRLFAVNHAFGKITWVAIGVSIVWTFGFFLGQILFCGSQPWYYWTSYQEITAHCGQGLYFLLCLATTDLATDAFIFFLPLPMIWRLHMPQRKKFFTSLMFLLGSISLVASALRLSIHVDHLHAGYAKKADVYLVYTVSFYWSMLEAGIALIAINLPVLNQLFGAPSVQSIIRSTRSILSLRSMSSRKSQTAVGVAKHSTSVPRSTTVAEKDQPRLTNDDPHTQVDHP